MFFSLVLILGCGSSQPEVQKQTRFLMDTYVTIQIPGGTEKIQIIEHAMNRIEAVDHKFNILEEGSELYQFNNGSGPVRDPEVLKLIRTALEIGEKTGGAFDITIYPLIKKWGFFSDNPSVPDSLTISRLLPHVGLDHLKWAPDRLVKDDPLTQIDLGGIAKGYAVGEAMRVIQSAGIQSALIDAGGDIYALGKLKGNDWKIGIRNPRGEGIIGTFDISDLAVVTSGDYERFFEQDGVRYHHILNPATGYPARGLASVTVITKDPAIADALSTAIFVMGQEKGLKFLETTGMAEAVIVTDDNQMFTTKGLR